MHCGGMLYTGLNITLLGKICIRGRKKSALVFLIAEYNPNLMLCNILWLFQRYHRGYGKIPEVQEVSFSL